MAVWKTFNCRRNFNELKAHEKKIICQFKAIYKSLSREKFN